MMRGIEATHIKYEGEKFRSMLKKKNKCYSFLGFSLFGKQERNNKSLGIIEWKNEGNKVRID